MPTTSIPIPSELTPRQAWEHLSRAGLDLWNADDIVRVMPVRTTRTSVYRQAQNGELPFPHLRIGRFYRFRPSDVSKYLRGVYGIGEAPAA